MLTLSGWTSPDIAAAFGVREDTVRLWRRASMQDGVEALQTRSPPGTSAVKAERALAAAEELLAPVADRPNWTLPPRLTNEIEKRAGVRNFLLAALGRIAATGAFR